MMKIAIAAPIGNLCFKAVLILSSLSDLHQPFDQRSA
jgi:hypothetical protein